MCGLAGLVDWECDLREAAVRLGPALSAALAHRGPDDEGRYLSSDGMALLVHRRLAIVDLTAGGHQPMSAFGGRYWLVWNGEVFNYRELRARLERDGDVFTSASDTEVLLAWLLRRGPDGLAAVRGMFALALWDAQERSLLLARDRFGIKPLYVAASHSRVAFASEVRALWSTGLVDRRVAPAGVLAYLAWGSVPSPLTWIEGVESLPPGTWAQWRGGRCTTATFADVRRRFIAPASVAQPGPEDGHGLRARVHAAVEDSVRAHLVADVPVGVFLSGGIDSSALVSAARSAGAGRLQTFTVMFDATRLSEHEHARAVARLFETSHHELRLDGRALVEDFPRILRHLDQPTVDGVNSFYVSRAVAATGIKAVLSGAGGDELFGGYPSFRRIPRAIRLKRRGGRVFDRIAPGMSWLLPRRHRAQWRQLCQADGRLAGIYRAQRGLFMPGQYEDLLGPALREPDIRAEAMARLEAAEAATFGPAEDASETAAVARLETTWYLRNQLLRDLDVMSMAHGLEVRVPLVDQDLLASVWPGLAAHPRLLAGKQLLYGTLARPLPPAIVNRPKQGFTLPFAAWMAGPVGPVVRDGLVRLADDGWIARQAPGGIWQAWRNGAIHWSRPWALGVLGQFLAATGGPVTAEVACLRR